MSDARFDDWANAATGLGGVRDKHTGVTFVRRRRLSKETLAAMYEQSPIVARVVDRKVDDALRNGWELADIVMRDGAKPPETPVLESKIDDLGIDEVVKKWAKWGRLFGGSLLTLPVYGGGPIEGPLDIATVTSFFRPQVVTADYARPLAMDVAFNSPTFLKVLKYDIAGLASSAITVHHSRVIKHEPIELPAEDLLYAGTVNGWGPSVVERLFDELGRDGASASHAVSMMYIASILYTKLTNFRNEMSTPQGKLKVRELLTAMRQQLDSLGVLGLDKNDEIGALNIGVSGMFELLDRMRARLAAAADMPKEILFNESPAGLNAGQLSGPQEIWFANVSAFQEETLTPAINRILEIAFAVWRIPIKSWTIRWRPLWTKSDREIAEIAEMQARTDVAYITEAVLSPDEVREARFVQGKSGPIEIPDDGPEPLDLRGITPDDVAAHEAAGAPAGGAETVAETAMNGAQVTSLVEIAQAVAAGLLPRESAIAIVRAAFPSAAAMAEQIIPAQGLAPPPAAAGAIPTAPPPVETPSTDAAPADLLSPADAAAKLGVPTVAITKLMRPGADGTPPRLRYWGVGAHKRVSFADVAAIATSHWEPEDPPS